MTAFLSVHTHIHTCVFSCCLSAARHIIQMLSFDCLSPRELNGVADLYQIECEMTSNLTLNYESHAGPSSFSPLTSCTLFHHERPPTPILSCVPRREHVQTLDFIATFFYFLPPILLRDLSYSVRLNNNKADFVKMNNCTEIIVSYF